MQLNLHNTLTRQTETFTPLDPDGKSVRMYVCGPTVYNHAHIGNFRTYVAVDLLRRTLELFGSSVQHIMQFTDVDDKTIRGSQQAAQPLRDFTRHYSEIFNRDLETLHILKPHQQPNATDHIQEMIALIQRLIDHEAAYLSPEDGSVYFRLSAFPNYGCLAHLDREGLKPGARVSQDDYAKESFGDFVLWKKRTEEDGDVHWPSPWGDGRPGWHIECSAISNHFLGAHFDLHCGGNDLIFPHHENEIAQSEAANLKKFVNTWFHVSHLLVDGRKMSKSLGNLYTVQEVLDRGYSGRDLRYALLVAHYRQNLNFTWKGMDDAKLAVARIDEWRKRFTTPLPKRLFSAPPTISYAPEESEATPNGKRTLISSTNQTTTLPKSNLMLENFTEQFRAALADDLNLPAALGHLFEFIRVTNKEMDAGTPLPKLNEIWAKIINPVLGLDDRTDYNQSIPAEIISLRNQRELARKTKNFTASDQLRDKMEALGWRVKDTAQGQELTKI